MNSAGAGPFSSVSWSQSPMSSPAAVSSVRATSTPRSIRLVWKEPVSNGSRILSYNIDVGDHRPLLTVDSDTLECDLVDLMPETAYKLVTLSCTVLSDFSVLLRRLLRVDVMKWVSIVRPSVRPSSRLSTKSLFDFSEIWDVGRGRRVMHDGMQYDPI